MITKDNFEDTVRQIVLEKLKIGYDVTIPPHYFENAEVHTYFDNMMDRITVGIRTYCTASTWSEQLFKNTSYQYEEVPLEWHDAFRLKYCPIFLTKKFPIKYRKIAIRSTTETSNKNTWIFPEIPPNANKDLTNWVV